MERTLSEIQQLVAKEKMEAQLQIEVICKNFATTTGFEIENIELVKTPTGHPDKYKLVFVRINVEPIKL